MEPDPESVEYWKQKANDIQQELDEYTENSAQLEKELEASLVQVEKQNRDLEHQNQRQKREIENLKCKLERSQQETNALEDELQSLKIDREKQALYVRELEQKNDDLERAQRVISESVSYIEALLNQAYERNAVLEHEVDEVETLRERLQRATDEARDLKQELKVMEVAPDSNEDSPNDNTPVANGHIPNAQVARAHVETETQTVLSTPQKREINGNAMTPSARVSAINIVGDLLRKVGLERFLCRECGKVKCSCLEAPEAPPLAAAAPPAWAPPTAPAPPPTGMNGTTDPDIELRTKSLMRQASNLSADARPAQPHRYSEQPFTRAAQSENGKLRRSFAVRSREGIENLLGLKRQPDHNKSRVARQ